jgi:hypothetical protein
MTTAERTTHQTAVAAGFRRIRPRELDRGAECYVLTRGRLERVAFLGHTGLRSVNYTRVDHDARRIGPTCNAATCNVYVVA